MGFSSGKQNGGRPCVRLSEHYRISTVIWPRLWGLVHRKSANLAHWRLAQNPCRCYSLPHFFTHALPRVLSPCSRNCVACFPAIFPLTWALPTPLFTCASAVSF